MYYVLNLYHIMIDKISYLYIFIYQYHFIWLMFVLPFKYSKDAYTINYNIYP